MKNFSLWTQLEVSAVLEQLKTQSSGLSTEQAGERLESYGPNHLDIRVERLSSILVRQLKSPFNYLLIIAGCIQVAIAECTSGLLIFVLTILNIAIGFFQEYKAYRAILSLRRYIPSMTHVMRDGKHIEIAKDLLVPGDIVLIKQGMVIPADLRLISGSTLVDEVTLTGEAEPISKTSNALQTTTDEIFNAKNILFAGTHVINGQGTAVVVSTGNQTVFYSITAGTGLDNKLSTYEKSLIALAKLIVRFVIITMILIFIVKHLVHAHTSFTQELVFFITLIVAIVPEALPTVVAFALSQSALKLAQRGVVVKRLSSMDDLGDIEILCTDKTGTLTELYLTVDTLVTQDAHRLLLYLLMDTQAHLPGLTHVGAFDDVIAAYADQDIKDSLRDYTVLDLVPFDSFRMRTTVLVQDKQGNRVLLSKGAPEILASLCGTSQAHDYARQAEQYGREGKRTLAVAYKQTNIQKLGPEVEHDMTYLGFIAFINPVKPDVAKTMEMAKKLGVQIKMITGDSKEVAGYVAQHVGMIKNQDDVVVGTQLATASTQEFDQLCRSCQVFARIDPETKAKIVDSLQKSFEVGFMGEGANDVPALKKANVALVVQEASDIARAVADIVLLKRNLAVVIVGIKQGRNTFSNINKYMICTLAGNFGNYYSLALFSLLIPFLPMLPTQLVLINLLSDFPLISIASDHVASYQIRRPKNYSLIKILPLIMLLGIVGTLSDAIFFALFYTQSPDMFRSLWFILNILSDVVLIYSVRTSRFFLNAPRPSLLMGLASTICCLICLLLPYSRIGHQWFSFVGPQYTDLISVFGIVVVYGAMNEIVKLLYFNSIAKTNGPVQTNHGH